MKPGKGKSRKIVRRAWGRKLPNLRFGRRHTQPHRGNGNR